MCRILLFILLLLPAVLRAAWSETNAPFATDLTLNALLARGNAEKGELGLKLETEGDTRFFDKIRSGFSGAYGKDRVDGVDSTTARRWELWGYARRPWDGENLYTFADARFLSDEVAEIHYRLTEGGGAGFFLGRSEKFEWTAEAGLSWVFEETDDDSDNYPAVRLGERYDREWENGTKLVQTLEVLPKVDELDTFFINADVTLTTAINKTLNLKNTLEYRYQSQPPEDAESSYDLRLGAGISWKF